MKHKPRVTIHPTRDPFHGYKGIINNNYQINDNNVEIE